TMVRRLAGRCGRAEASTCPDYARRRQRSSPGPACSRWALVRCAMRPRDRDEQEGGMGKALRRWLGAVAAAAALLVGGPWRADGCGGTVTETEYLCFYGSANPWTPALTPPADCASFTPLAAGTVDPTARSVTTARFFVQWTSTDPEAISTLRWPD